jgi:hypothetical protein
MRLWIPGSLAAAFALQASAFALRASADKSASAPE